MHWFLAGWATQSFLLKAGVLFATMAVSGAVFLGCGVALRIDELNEVIRAVRRRFARS
jgi:hypothetical protein